MSRTRIDNDPLEGAGPWRFTIDAQLAPGDSELFDFRNMEYRGRKGFFRKYLPLDQATVTNLDPSANLDVTYNGVFDQFVTPNTAESFSQAGITSMTVTNPSSSSVTVDAGNVVVEVVRDPYDADDAARERARSGPVEQVVEKFTGIRPNLGGL